MELSMFIAKIVGVLYLAMSVGVLVGGLDLKKLYSEIMKSPALEVLMGMMAVILGLLVLEYHNVWTSDWTVLITIIGWLALIKGVLIIAYPKALTIFDPIFKSSFVNIMPYFIFVFGLIFAYFGFYG